jgi:ABC-type Fe3+ transport system substrate-binding protein
MRYRALLITGLGTLIGAFLATDAPAANWEQLLQKLYPAAKKEGGIIFNTERNMEVGGKEGVEKFQKRFPGVKVIFNGLAGSKLPSRLIAESMAGRVSIDAFRSDPVRAEPLAEKDLLMTVNPKELTDQPLRGTFFKNRFFKTSDHITNFACNTDFVSAANRPKRYEDLLDPRWEKKLVLDARGGQIAHLMANGIWTKERFWDFVRRLKNQKPLWTSRNTEAMAKLTAGEGYIGTGSYAAIEELKKQGAPVDFLFLSPSLAQVRGVSIVKGSPHPNAAKLFLGWLLSPEGIQAMDKMGVGTVTPGTTIYKKVKAAKADIFYEDTFDKIAKRDGLEEEITKEWGVLK